MAPSSIDIDSGIITFSKFLIVDVLRVRIREGTRKHLFSCYKEILELLSVLSKQHDESEMDLIDLCTLCLGIIGNELFRE